MSSGPNAEMLRYWNETSGPRWVARMEQLDAQLAELGRLAIERARPALGERVVDVGCGCGDTVVQLAAHVGRGGRVLGVDISAPMLERASQRARDLPQVELLLADAQVHRFEPGFDLVFSRFGVMFFQDPVAAFANLRGALRPGGRVVFVCWDEIGRNPWMRVPLVAMAAHVPLPEPPPPGAPGPFSFAEPERVRGILERAGFARFESVARAARLDVGGGVGLDGAVEFLLSVGPASRALSDVDEATRTLVAGAVRESIAPFARDGEVRMDSSVWICSAEAPR